MAIFACERYPQLRVLDAKNPKRYIATFRDGFFETEDPEVISQLMHLSEVTLVSGSRRGEVSGELGHPSSLEDLSIPQPQASEVLKALIEEGLQLRTLRRRGNTILFGRRALGTSIFEAVHTLYTNRKLAEEIARKNELARNDAQDSRGLREEEDRSGDV